MEFWLGRLSPGYRKVASRNFRAFMEWAAENSDLPRDPDALVEFQRLRKDYAVLDVAQAWVSSEPGWSVAYKKGLLSSVRSFFAHNRCPLPPDPAFRVRSEKPKTRGVLTVEEVRRLLDSCNRLYRAAFLCMVMGGMGVGELLWFSEHGYRNLVSQLEAGARLVKVDLPGRKRGRNVMPFYTFLGRDAVAALRDYLEERPRGGEAVFVTQQGGALNEWALRRYWLRHLVELGLVKPVDAVGMDSKKYGVRYGKNPHELRDIFRTRWHKSGADASAAEFMMGHVVDPNEYDKAFSDVDYARGQYRRAEAWLNVVSEDPEVVPRERYEDLQQRQETTIENLQARLGDVERMLRELSRFKELEDELKKLKKP